MKKIILLFLFLITGISIGYSQVQVINKKLILPKQPISTNLSADNVLGISTNGLLTKAPFTLQQIATPRADSIIVTPAVNLNTDLQSVLEDHEARIDGLAAGGSDGVVSNVTLTGSDLVFTGTGGGFNGSIPLSSLSSTGSGHVVQDEGVNITQRDTITFNGGGVTVTDDPIGEKTIVTIPGTQISVTSVSGWADYTNTQYTLGSPLSILADTDTQLPNNRGLVRDTEKPSDIIEFVNSSGQITGNNGDAYLATIEYKVVPTNAGTTYIDTWFDIGGAVGQLYRRPVSFPKGVGVERPVVFSTGIYTLDTWETNSATVYIRANGTADIYDIRFIVYRLHKAGNEFVQSNSMTSDDYSAIINSTGATGANPFATIADLPTNTSDLINDSGFITSATDDQTATEVPFTPYLTLTSINTQSAIEELKDEVNTLVGTDDQTAAEVSVAATPANYTPANGTVEGHLSGIDTALASAGGGTDDQTASEVPFTPYLTITSTDTQSAIQELKDEVDAGGGTDDQTAAEVPLTDSGGNWTATNLETFAAEVADSLSVKVNINPNSLPIELFRGSYAAAQAEYGVDENTWPEKLFGIIPDYPSTQASLDDLSDVTKGSVAANSSSTLRVLADPDSNGTYNEIDWTPPGSVGNFIEEDDQSPISGFKISVGDSTSLANQTDPVGYYRINIDTTATSSITSDGFLTAMNLSLVGSDLTITNTMNGLPNVVSNTIALPSGGVVTGNETAFDGWDKNAADDFDGVFTSLTSIPAGLLDGDDDTIADGSETIINQGSNITITGTGTSGNPYIINGTAAAVTGNEAVFDGWDKDASDDVTTSDIGSSVQAYSANMDTDSTNDVEQDASSPITGFKISVGNTAALAAQPAPSGYYRVNIDTTTVTASPTTDYYIDDLTLGLSGSNLTVTAGRNGTTDVVSNTIGLPTADGSETVVTAGTNITVTGTGTSGNPYIINSTASGGATNLAYTASPTQGTVTSDTGTDAIIPSGSTTNASLMTPADKTKLDGIEAGAEVNQTDSEILTQLLNVDGPGSLLNADFLDGVTYSETVVNSTLPIRTANGDVRIAREAYSASWNNSDEAAPKGDIYTKIESLGTPVSQTSGTFVPDIIGTTGDSFTFTVSTATYVKTGVQVYFNIRLTNINGTSTGTFELQDLPFIANGQHTFGSIIITGISDNFYSVNAYIIDNTSRVRFSTQTALDGNNNSGFVAVGFTTGTLEISGYYTTD